MKLKGLRSAATLSFSVALAGVMFAQGSSSGQQPTTGQRGQGMQHMDGQTVTVTGCLVRASDLRGGAAATTGTTPSGTTAGTTGTGANDYVLTNVLMRSTSPGGTTGTTTGGTGTTGTTGGTGTTTSGAASGSRGMNLRLSGGADAKFTEHVNQQVEVTGRLSMRESGDSTRGTTGTTGTGTTGTGTTGTTGTGTTGTGTTATGTTASSAGQMGQLQVQTIRATGQSCTAGGGQE